MTSPSVVANDLWPEYRPHRNADARTEEATAKVRELLADRARWRARIAVFAAVVAQVTINLASIASILPSPARHTLATRVLRAW